MMVGTQNLGGSLPPLNSPKSYGITKPLSLAGPSSADIKRNVELEKVKLCFCFTRELLKDSMFTFLAIWCVFFICSSTWLMRDSTRARTIPCGERKFWDALIRWLSVSRWLFFLCLDREVLSFDTCAHWVSESTIEQTYYVYNSCIVWLWILG